MYQLVFLLVWVIAASVFRDSPTHAPGFFGLVYGFWSLGSLGGALFSSVFVQHLTMDNVHLIVFAAVLAVAVGYAVMFTEACLLYTSRLVARAARQFLVVVAMRVVLPLRGDLREAALSDSCLLYTSRCV